MRESKYEPFQITTDTATLCVFDLDAAKARLHDSADWWTTPETEILELNAGNVAFFGLGSDGVFVVHMVDDLPDAKAVVNLRAPSGRVFIGAGEEVSSDGLEPEGLRGGLFLDVDQGNYVVRAMRVRHDIFLSIRSGGSSQNGSFSPVRLD